MPWEQVLAGSNPAALTNFLNKRTRGLTGKGFGLRKWIWEFESLRVYQLAGIAKRPKATVCKTVNHRFKSDYPLQLREAYRPAFREDANAERLPSGREISCGT